MRELPFIGPVDGNKFLYRAQNVPRPFSELGGELPLPERGREFLNFGGKPHPLTPNHEGSERFIHRAAPDLGGQDGVEAVELERLPSGVREECIEVAGCRLRDGYDALPKLDVGDPPEQALCNVGVGLRGTILQLSLRGA